MSRVTCQADESRLTCLCGPVPDVLSRLPCHGCPAKLSRPGCPYPSCTEPYSHVLVISSLATPRYITPTVLSGFSVLAILSRLYCPGCCVLAVLSRLYCPGCSVLAVLPQLSCPSTLFPALATVLSLLSCPYRPVQSVLSGRPVYTDSSRFFSVPSQFSCPCCRVPAILSPLSCPNCPISAQFGSSTLVPSFPVPAVLSLPSRPDHHVHSVLSKLTCLGRPNKWVC
jgi:hypothetical protein